MIVKVHPHRTMVQAGVEACVSVTPVKRYGRAYYMGTVFLRDASFRVHESGVKRAQAEQVRNVHAWAVGDLVAEWPEQGVHTSIDFLSHFQKVTYHFDSGRFLTYKADRDAIIDVTDGDFAAMVFVGRDFYVSKEGLV